MDIRKIAIIFVLPVVIMLWGIGWIMYYSGKWILEKSKNGYKESIKILKSEGLDNI